MTRSVLLLTLLKVSVPAVLLWGNTDPPAPPASMPWEIEVYREYCPELMDEAHVADCWTGYDEEELHIVAVTDMPTLIPSEMDMIPVLTVAPPAMPPAPLAAWPRAVEVYRASCPGLVAEVHVEDCWTGYVGEELHLVVVTDSPDLIPAEVDTIPTITMVPPTEDGSDNSENDTDKAEGDADTSDSDSQGTDTTTSGESGQDDSESDSSGPAGQSGESTEGGSSSETQNPSIAGIPYATAVEIFSRQNFMTLAGVLAVWLDADGIVVLTDQPDLVPSTFESLPVRTETLGSNWVTVHVGRNTSNAR